MDKIKDSNKDRIKLNIYTDNPVFFIGAVNSLRGVQVEIIHTAPHYQYKIGVIKDKCETKYSMKLDEDVFISNHIFDYIMENLQLLDNPDNLILAPILSCGIPTGEYFINDYFGEPEREEIHKTFLEFGFGENGVPENPWGCNVRYLNKLTRGAEKWDGMKWLEETNDIAHHYKGYHPLRNGYATHKKLNELILKNPDKLSTNNEYGLISLKNRYYTNSAFVIKSDTWVKILCDESLYRDIFDEVPLNLYMQINNLNYLFIKNGFAVHTMYNTNVRPGDDNAFFNELKKLIIK